MKKNFLQIILGFCALSALAETADDLFPLDDLVESLPDVDLRSKPDNKLHYHYVLVEAEVSPENAPLLLWTNGGPGASSLWGLFTEIGPLWLTEESIATEEYKRTGIPTLFESDTSWTKFANVLILSGPPPVSFNYCDKGGVAGNGYSCGPWTDELTADANFLFLEGFFKKFPVFEQRKTEFYITGESYAGIYIPTLVENVLEHKHSISYKLLKGLAIGDGCIGKDIICAVISDRSLVVEQKFSAQFLYGHGQVPTPLYNQYIQQCQSEFESYESLLNFKSESSLRTQRELSVSAKHPSQKCDKLYKELRDTVGYFNVYNLYDECWKLPNVPSEMLTSTKYEPYPCGGSVVLGKYLDKSEVKRALNVPVEAKIFSGDNGVGFDYTATVKNLLPWHRKVAESHLRVLIYNGDTDHELNSFFSEWWVGLLDLPLKEGWRAWTLDGKKEVVGYSVEYGKHFLYATIRGSGHMVPTMKPYAAYEMMKQWINNEPLKEQSYEL